MAYMDRDITATIKRKIKDIRKQKGISQAKLAEGIHVGDNQSGRTSVTNWESEKNTTLPNLLSFLEICDYFGVDCDYLLGRSPIKSQDNAAIAEAIHISEEGVMLLRENPKYGTLIDFLVHLPALSEITNRLYQLSYIDFFEDVMNTSFSPELKQIAVKSFDKFQNHVFPMYMTSATYEMYLKKEIPFTKDFDGADYLEKYFMEDGKRYIYNSHNDFGTLASPKQYSIIISAIADISYEFLMRRQVVELSKQRVVRMLSDCVEQFIQSEGQRVKADIKANLFKATQEV